MVMQTIPNCEWSWFPRKYLKKSKYTIDNISCTTRCPATYYDIHGRHKEGMTIKHIEIDMELIDLVAGVNLETNSIFNLVQDVGTINYRPNRPVVTTMLATLLGGTRAYNVGVKNYLATQQGEDMLRSRDIVVSSWASGRMLDLFCTLDSAEILSVIRKLQDGGVPRPQGKYSRYYTGTHNKVSIIMKATSSPKSDEYKRKIEIANKLLDIAQNIRIMYNELEYISYEPSLVTHITFRTPCGQVITNRYELEKYLSHRTYLEIRNDILAKI